MTEMLGVLGMTVKGMLGLLEMTEMLGVLEMTEMLVLLEMTEMLGVLEMTVTNVKRYIQVITAASRLFIEDGPLEDNSTVSSIISIISQFGESRQTSTRRRNLI